MRSIAWAFFPGMNISDNISLPRETDLHCYFAIETGTLISTVSGRGSADFLALGSPVSRRRVCVRDHKKSENLIPQEHTISVMTPTLASARPAFFQQYNFDFDPHATLHTEFRRWAKIRNWKQGSNSRIFEKAWSQCFGSEVPVGHNIDGMESRFEAQYGTDNEDFSSMLRSLQSLDLEGGTNKKARVRRAGTEFASHYGSDARVTKRWQALCQDCGVNLVPSSINQCKKVQSLQRCARRDPRGRIHANVSFRSLGTQRCEYQHHFLDAKRAGRIPHHFRSRRELAVYMEENPGERYPLKMAKQNKFLSVLLIKSW